MLQRLLPLVACLFVALPIEGAPAPFRRKEAAQPEVLIRGFLPEGRRPPGEPWAVGNQADYRALAAAWGIPNPPRVDFRSHFLAAHVTGPYLHIMRFEVADGDVRPVTYSTAHILGLEVPGHHILIQSFRRSAVKTVKGYPPPR
jgi:hypothetical protein